MIRLVVIMLVAACCCMAARGQVSLHGCVADSLNGEPIVGASVKLIDADGKIRKFASTRKAGVFIMKAAITDGMKIEVSMIGYAKKSVPVTDGSVPVNVCLMPQTMKLKEVAVTAARIRENGDTITYDVTSFSQKQDRSIGDVLNRMPGIDVDEKGKIQYQGTDINKFYIEGNDLLGGKYGVATKNIDHTDVGAVEVMENHQPMQVLRGLSISDQAAINLKMKKRAKATIVAHGDVGGGYSMQPHGALWQGSLFAMMLSGRYQMLTTVRANNTGDNLNEQLFNFTADDAGDNISGYLSLSASVSPGLRRQRTLMNRSWALSSSHLWKNKRGGEFKAQVDYINDRTTAESKSSTTYFLESGDRVIFEDKGSLGHTDAVSGMFSYEANEKTFFLNNTLNVNASWNDLSLTTAGTLANMQKSRTPEYGVTNHLKVIKKYSGKHLVSFSSVNKWESLPERVSIAHNGVTYGQRISQHAFYTDERASYGFLLRRVLVSLEGGLSGYLRRLTTDMTGDLPGMGDAGYDMDNSLTTDYFRLFVSPKLEWNRRKVELSLKVPLNFYTYFFSAGLKNRTELFAAPSVNFRWKMTPRMDLTFGGSARRSPASLHNIHPGVTLSDYRTFQAGVDDYYSTSGQSVSLAYQYRYPAKGIFLSARCSHNWNKTKHGSEQTLVGDYIIYSYRSRPGKSQATSVSATANKSLDFMRGIVGANLLYMINRNEVYSQGSLTDYRSRSLILSSSLSGSVTRWLNWSYRFGFTRSVLAMDMMKSQHTDNYRHSFSATLIPHDKLRCTVSGEYYRNAIEAHRYKDMTILDAKLTYSITKRIEVTASVSNLFDYRKYAYTTYGTLSAMEHASTLRGREFLISLYLKK